MPKFEQTFCSQCGEAFGPGDNGYSHCDQHGPTDDKMLAGEDWENACHELLWEKGQDALFAAIQGRAVELMAERLKPRGPQISTNNPDEPRF